MSCAQKRSPLAALLDLSAYAASAVGDQQSSAQWRASKLVGLRIYGPNNTNVGKIIDVLMDHDGKAQAVVIGVGGFLGIGENGHGGGLQSDRVLRPARDAACVCCACGGNRQQSRRDDVKRYHGNRFGRRRAEHLVSRSWHSRHDGRSAQKRTDLPLQHVTTQPQDSRGFARWLRRCRGGASVAGAAVSCTAVAFGSGNGGGGGAGCGQKPKLMISQTGLGMAVLGPDNGENPS